MRYFMLSVERARVSHDSAVALLEAAIRRIELFLASLPEPKVDGNGYVSSHENIWN